MATDPLNLDPIKTRADRCHDGLSSNVTHYIESQADVPALVAEIQRLRTQLAQTRGTTDIVITAMAYTHATPGDEAEDCWHALKGAVDHYEAVARRLGRPVTPVNDQQDQT